MATYADLIFRLPLLNQLRSSKGRDDVSAAEVDLLVAMVLNAAETLGPLLDRIPLTFRQYTRHDLRHSANIIRLMGKFIPSRTFKKLNAVELTMLALSAIVHDAGMFVSDGEKEQAVASPEFQRFTAGQGERMALLEKARTAGEHLRAAALQDALLAEYFRRLHPERAASVVKAHLKQLTFRETDLTPALLRIAESHGWGVLESNDPHHPGKSVNRLSPRRPVSSVPVNEQYIACCLRLGDIMDFDRTRTPASVFQHLGFTEQKSWEEWNKHLQVEGWHVTEHEVMYTASCSHPAFYVAVMEFLDWIDTELRDCRHLIKEAPKNIADHYELNLPPVVDRRQVEMEDPSYLAGAFRFQLDYERIMRLLMDRSLYPDPSLFLRELLQNALDACRTRQAHAEAKKAEYTARITAWDYSDDPSDPRVVFQDNGIGMSRHIVENYFMRVGRSYYVSAEFDLERQRLSQHGVELEATSQFGIGILSVFLVADRFEVETYRVGHPSLYITIEGPTKYFTIRLLSESDRIDFPTQPSDATSDAPPTYPGTRVTIHLRSGVTVDVKTVLEQFAANVDFDIHIIGRGGDGIHVIPKFRWRNQNIKPNSVLAGNIPGVGGGAKYSGSVLNSILLPAQVPLSSYDFAAHLDGQAWFWLLHGPKGKPFPNQGYLKLRMGIRCTGAAAFSGRLIELERDGRLETLEITLDSLIEAIADALIHEEDPFSGLSVPWAADLHGEISSDFWEQFSDEWNEFSYGDREAILSSLENYHSGATPWYRDLEAARHLLSGEIGWSYDSIDTSRELRIKPSQALAMYGIRLSAGVVSWDPMAGIGNRKEFMAGPGGIAVDIRGKHNIVPAASRLFVDSRDADDIALPLLRALIRYGVELAEPNDKRHALNWRGWLNTVVTPLFYHNEWQTQLENFELENVERTCRYRCHMDGNKVLMSRDELVETFGDWIPISSFKRKSGIDAFDRTNLLLISHRPRERRKIEDVVDLTRRVTKNR